MFRYKTKGTCSREIIFDIEDDIIKEVAGGKQLDLNSEKVLNDIIKKMDTEFYASNYIEYNQSVDTLFSGGISGLKSTIKKI